MTTSVTSGKYKGVQQRIKCVCPYANFCPCFAHSLNLAGTCAVESNADDAALFWLIQRVYTFYSASTKLWQIQVNMIEGSEKLTLLLLKGFPTRDGQQDTMVFKPFLSRIRNILITTRDFLI